MGNKSFIKKILPFATIFLLLTTITLILVACVAPASVTSITINGASSVVEGESATYTATITPNNATNQRADWKVVDAEFGTIDSNGEFFAKKAGTAYITATVGGVVSEAYKVTIKSDVFIAPKPDSAIDAEPITAGQDNIPQILGSFTDGSTNYYLVYAGYILNHYIGNMGIVHYNGQTPITSETTVV